MKKRRLVILLKIFLDNFKFYIKLNRFIGDLNSYFHKKMKIPRNYHSSILFRKKKRVKRGFFFKWDRFRSLYVKLSPLGTYYYWFARINKLTYYISFYKFFFNTIFKSFYLKNIIILYLVLLSILYFLNKKYNNNIIFNTIIFKPIKDLLYKYIKK